MPYCSTCNDYLEGRGPYCLYHRPSAYARPGDGDTHSIRYRTGHGRNHDHEYGPRAHTCRDQECDTHDGYGNTCSANGDELAVTCYERASHVQNPTATQRQLQAAVNTFERMATSYSINHMSMSVDQQGVARSVSVAANKDRERCAVCRDWFPDHGRLMEHKWQLPSGCDVHETCFAREEEHYHGTAFRHRRCFVRGCASPYRREGGWKTGVVEDHVRKWHV